MSEGDRAPTKMDLLLSLLSDGQWHPTDQLIEEVGHRFSATIHLARQAGHRIERRRDGFDNEWRLTVSETPGRYNLGKSESEPLNMRKSATSNPTVIYGRVRRGM